MTDFLHDPAVPAALDLSMVDPVAAGGRSLTGCWRLAADLLLWGDWARGGEYLDLLERAQPAIPPDSELAARLAAAQSLPLTRSSGEHARGRASGPGRAEHRRADAARGRVERVRAASLLRAYTWLEDFEAVDREAAAALAMPSLTEPAKLVHVRGAQALAWFDAGRMAEAGGGRPGRRRPTRRGWDSTSTPSPWTTCVLWRGRAGAAGPRRRGAAHRAGAVDIGALPARL